MEKSACPLRRKRTGRKKSSVEALFVERRTGRKSKKGIQGHRAILREVYKIRKRKKSQGITKLFREGGNHSYEEGKHLVNYRLFSEQKTDSREKRKYLERRVRS